MTDRRNADPRDDASTQGPAQVGRGADHTAPLPGADDPVGAPGENMRTAAPAAINQPRLGLVGWLRWGWRQLTSMRTALLLLLLVAVAAIPGSVWPQRSIDAGAVNDYIRDNPTTGVWLSRLGFFDVFSSPWFSAIYLLLFISVIGCVVPRTLLHWRAVRSAPPRTPRRLQRLPAHATFDIDEAPQAVALRARTLLRSGRYRVRAPRDGESDLDVSAETGYLRETGNLLFHTGILVIIVALAWGYLVGWKADRIVPVGQSFTNSVSGYDTFSPGPWVDPDALVPFRVRIDDLKVRFEENAGGAQFGAARDFSATTTITATPGAAPQQQELRVNGPLRFGGAAVYLLGNGYAPKITVRDATGKVLYSQATPFLPQDGVYTSVGAVKVPAASPKQLGFTGVFLPSAAQGADGPVSAFPDMRNPVLILSGFEGPLFANGSQSVYTLDTDGLTQLKGSDGSALRLALRPGQTVQLPGGRGSVTLDKVDRWAGLSTRYDPAKPLALGAALVSLLGLVGSLLVRRRRVFVRVSPGAGGGSRVEVAGLARGEDALLGEAVAAFASRLSGRPSDASPGGVADQGEQTTRPSLEGVTGRPEHADPAATTPSASLGGDHERQESP